MKNKIVVLIVISFLAISAYLAWEKKSNQGINTIAIVTKQAQIGDVYIFFEQDTTVGKVEVKGEKYFFFTNTNPSIFFVKYQLKEGFIEKYVLLQNSDIREVEYATEMSIKEIPDTSYQVIGGSYRNIKTPYYKNGEKALNFIIFKAGFARDIKSNFAISDSFVEQIYLKEKALLEIDN